MKSKYSDNKEIKDLNPKQTIDLAKQKNSTTFWRSVILSGKLVKRQLEDILQFVKGSLNVNLILEKTGYPKNADRIVGKLAQAIKNTKTSERRSLIYDVFRKTPKQPGMILAKKINTIQAWRSQVMSNGSTMKTNDLMELGNRFNDGELWVYIVRYSYHLKEEQIQSIQNANCFSDKNWNYTQLLHEIIQNKYHEYPYFCIDILIELFSLISEDKSATEKEQDHFVKHMLERIDWTEVELSKLIQLYFRTKEDLLLEMMYLRCVSLSNSDIDRLLRNGHKNTKEYILSKVKI